MGILWPALFGVRSRRGIVATTLVALLGTQWILEGFRWPLTILFIVALAMAAGDILSLERELPWFRRVGRAIFGLVGLGLAVAPAVLFPVPQLPVPSGPEPIGTAVVDLVHGELIETFGPSPGGRRQIRTQVWYPAELPDAATPELWIPAIDVVGPAVADEAGVPGFLFNSARYTRTHSYLDATPQQGGFPLVVFSHDWGGFRSIALPQIENLVSQGYVVIAIDHAYVAAATVIDGEAYLQDEGARGTEEDDSEAILAADSALIDVMAADLTLVLDQVEAGADGAYARFARAFDGGIVGLWGHGAGGGAALQVCLLDERCDAVAGMDPLVEPYPDPVLATTAVKPMLFLRSDAQRDTLNDAILDGLVSRSETVTYWVSVFGADSTDFVATPLVSPVGSNIGLRGPIDGTLVQLINRRFVTGFFDRFLLQTGAAALETADFDVIEVDVRDNS